MSEHNLSSDNLDPKEKDDKKNSEIDLESQDNQDDDEKAKEDNKEDNKEDISNPLKNLQTNQEKKTCAQRFIYPRFNKGFMSNFTTFLIMVLGLILTNTNKSKKSQNTAGHYILAFGLFGFAGGITNWLAIKMLFDRIPGLYGSGIIPRRFKEIRETVKNTIMKTFFDETYLKNYISTKLNSFISMINFEEKIKKVLESPAVSQIIDQKLEELKDRPEGLMLTMMGIDPSSLKPLITPFVLGMGSDIAPLLLSTFDITKTFDISRVRKELDSLMTEKLKELTPQVVKKLMEDVMRKHLGWLIVWGNVFGGIIGVISYASGYK